MITLFFNNLLKHYKITIVYKMIVGDIPHPFSYPILCITTKKSRWTQTFTCNLELLSFNISKKLIFSWKIIFCTINHIHKMSPYERQCYRLFFVTSHSKKNQGGEKEKASYKSNGLVVVHIMYSVPFCMTMLLPFLFFFLPSWISRKEGKR